MVTGGKKAPAGLGDQVRAGVNAAHSRAPPPPTGQNVVQARNAKKAALDDFAKANNIKPESVKKAYKRFQVTDRDKSGLLDYTEFCEVLQVDPSPQCETVFKLYDYDKAGQIDAREFLIAITNYSGAGKEDKLKFAFSVFDEEGNGVITKAELLKILKVRKPQSSTFYIKCSYSFSGESYGLSRRGGCAQGRYDYGASGQRRRRGAHLRRVCHCLEEVPKYTGKPLPLLYIYIYFLNTAHLILYCSSQPTNRPRKSRTS